MPTTGTSPSAPLLKVTVPRRIEASPEEVFDAWAEPDLFRRWLEPRRAVLRKAAVDELWYWEAEHLAVRGRTTAATCAWSARDAGVRLGVGSDARTRIPGDHRDDALPRRYGPGVDAQRAPRRRVRAQPRGWLEQLHRGPGREDQEAAVSSLGRSRPSTAWSAPDTEEGGEQSDDEAQDRDT